MQFRKQQLELDMEQQTGCKLGNTSRLYIVALLISLLCRVHHEKHWAGRSTSWNQDCWGNINNLRYADDTTLMAESEEGLKSLLMKVKEDCEKIHLKLNIQKTKLMAWSHHFMANRWGNNGNSKRLFSWAPKSLQTVTPTMKLKKKKNSCSLEEKL